MVKGISIYDDNDALRKGIEDLLLLSDEFYVCGSYNNCIHIEEQLKNDRPELVLMDIDMPGVNGIEGVKKIKSEFPDIKVVMYTVFDDDTRIFDCLCAGADGYLLKNTSPVKLIQSLQELAEGGAPMSPFVAQKVFTFFRNNKPAEDTFNLTPREKEILELLVRGNSYKMIADKSSVSVLPQLF